MDSKLFNNMEDLEQFFGSRMRDYEEKLLKATSGAVPVHADLAALSSDFSEFKLFVVQTLNKLKAQIELLTLGLDRHETQMRSKVLLLHGVPEKSNEKLCESINKIIADKMGLAEVNMHSFSVCHRLGAPRGKTRPVLLRFYNIEHRRLVWDSKKSLKNSGITISEFLTKSRHRVFMAARKHYGIKNCWSVEGKISIITTDKTRRKIETMAELEDLIVQFPPEVENTDEHTSSADCISPKGASTKTTAKNTRRARRGH